MAQLLRLATEDQATTVDLIAGTFSLRPGTWETRTTEAMMEISNSAYGAKASFKRYDLVTETMGLIARNESVATLTAAINNIEEMQDLCRRWHADPNVHNSVWLEWNANGESAKRSLVYDLRIVFGNQGPLGPMLMSGYSPARLSIRRHPMWENPALVTYTSGSYLSGTGGAWTASATTVGTAPSRIENMWTRLSGTGADSFDKLWVGIRDTYEGVSNFQSVYECEAGTFLSYPDMALAGEAGCMPSGSSNNKITCDFATTTTLANRLAIRLGDVVGASDLAAQTGTYVVLLRCKLSAAGTVGVQLRYGGQDMSVDQFLQCEEVFITNTAYRLIELGEVSIPAYGNRSALTDGLGGLSNISIADTTWHFWMERIDGTPTVSLDCIILIPALHYCKMTGIDVEPVGQDAFQSANLITFEDDSTTAIARHSEATSAVPVEYTVRDFYFPSSGALVVAACERGTGHLIADGIQPTMRTFPRWLSYRGS